MAIEFFLKIDGIKGDSTDKVHQGEIQLQSFSWGATNVVREGSPTGGGGAGKPSVAEFSFTASTSQASPELFRAVVTGKVFPTATVTGVRTVKAEQVTVLELKFTDVVISSYWISDAPGAELPADAGALAFSKVEYTFTPQKADGSAGTPVAAGWDVKDNKAA
jgi:type VI secretion system secreted protein Hcp